MDTIRFAIEDYIDRVNGFQFPTINIYINGKNLIHLVEQIERGNHDLLETDQPYQQSYVGLHPEYRRNFRKEFLGQTKLPASVLLTCTCLEALCNSIVARVVAEAQTVTWREIRSPFFSIDSQLWKPAQDLDEIYTHLTDYSRLGPFVFDRKQYLVALNALELGE